MPNETLDVGPRATPLEKYSSAVSPEGSRNHRWIHDLRKELLTLTFKTVDIPINNHQYEERMFMAVAAGRDVLVRSLVFAFVVRCNMISPFTVSEVLNVSDVNINRNI